MLKTLIILALMVYVLSKIGSFFFRAGISSQQPRYQQRTPEQNNMNRNAKVNPTPRKDRKGSIKGGEYVDYEDVK